MAYDVYSDVHKIYGLKGQWEKANTDGDSESAQRIATEAQQYYKSLQDNGYSDVADKLSKSSVSQAKTINDFYAQTGKSSFRDYFYSKGANVGLSKGEIDKMISYNDATGEVSFAGKNVGKPYSVVDGVSYWNNDDLDKIWSDYASTSGYQTIREVEEDASIKKKVNSLYGNQETDRADMTQKYDRAEELAYSNPYETDIGKSIMSIYGFEGEKASDGAIAANAGSNNGNIDSYAAANAKRQQLAFKNAGVAAVLNDHNSRIGNVRGILSDLGIYLQGQDASMQGTIVLEQNEAQRMHDNNEKEKDCIIAREIAKSEVTGYVPDGWIKEDNPYLDASGNLVNSDVDYQQIIDNATEKLKTESNPTVRASLEKTIRDANVARNIKIRNNPELYGQYADTMVSVPGHLTADEKQFYESIASAERITDANNASAEKQTNATLQTQKEINDADNQAQKEMNDASLAAQKYMQAADIEAEKELLRMQLEATPDLSEEELKSGAVDAVRTWVFSPVADADGNTSFQGYTGEEIGVYIACEKLANKDMLAFIVDTFRDAGFTDSEIRQKITELRDYVAIETLKAEGRADTSSEEAIKSVWNRYQWAEADVFV